MLVGRHCAQGVCFCAWIRGMVSCTIKTALLRQSILLCPLPMLTVNCDTLSRSTSSTSHMSCYTWFTSWYHISSYQCNRVRMKELAGPLFLVTHATSFQLIGIMDNISIFRSGYVTKEMQSRYLYPPPIPTKPISCNHVVSFITSLHMNTPSKMGIKVSQSMFQ